MPPNAVNSGPPLYPKFLVDYDIWLPRASQPTGRAGHIVGQNCLHHKNPDLPASPSPRSYFSIFYLILDSYCKHMLGVDSPTSNHWHHSRNTDWRIANARLHKLKNYRLFRLSWYISVHSKMYTLSGFLTTDNVIIVQKGERLLLFSSQIAYLNLVCWPCVAILTLQH